MSIVELGQTIHVDFITHDPALSGAAADADSTPTCEVLEDDTDTAILSPTVSRRTGKVGDYRVPIAVTVGNGFEAGKSYNVIASATVSGIGDKETIATFIPQAIGLSGVADAVADEALAGHLTVGTVGDALNRILEASWRDYGLYVASDGEGGAIDNLSYPQALAHNGKVYFTYQGQGRLPRVVVADATTRTVSPSYPVDTTIGLPWSDGHGHPAMCFDANDYLHVFHGTHADYPHHHRRSSAPEDITAWEDATAPGVRESYPQPYLMANDDIWLWSRCTAAEGAPTESGFRSSALVLYVSADNGVTWAAGTEIIAGDDGTHVTSPYYRVLPNVALTGCHIAWRYYKPFASPSPVQIGVYYAYWNGTQLTAADGTVLTLPLSMADADLHCRIYDTGADQAGIPAVEIFTGAPMVVSNIGSVTASTYYFWRWTGAAWTAPVAITTTDQFSEFAALWQDATTATTIWCALNKDGSDATDTNGGDIQLWRSLNSGATWAVYTTWLSAAQIGGLLYIPQRVYNDPKHGVIFISRPWANTRNKNLRLLMYRGDDGWIADKTSAVSGWLFSEAVWKAAERTLTAWLSGSVLVTIQLRTAGGAPIAGCPVRVANSGGTVLLQQPSHSSTGNVVVALDTANNYTVVCGPFAGWTFAGNPTDLDVGTASTQTLTITGAASAAPTAPTNPALCRCYVYVYHLGGADAGNPLGAGEATLWIHDIILKPVGTALYGDSGSSGVNDALGFTYVDVARGAIVNFALRRPVPSDASPTATKTVPADNVTVAAAATMDLSSYFPW